MEKAEKDNKNKKARSFYKQVSEDNPDEYLYAAAFCRLLTSQKPFQTAVENKFAEALVEQKICIANWENLSNHYRLLRDRYTQLSMEPPLTPNEAWEAKTMVWDSDDEDLTDNQEECLSQARNLLVSKKATENDNEADADDNAEESMVSVYITPVRGNIYGQTKLYIYNHIY